ERLVARHGVVDELVSDLRRSFPKVKRLRAAMALAELADDEAVPVLLEHLDDREPEIRVQAARGLGRMKWTPAIDAIVARFGMETPWVRARFADTLIGFGSAATWPLVAYVTVNHRHETAGPVAAIRTLAAIGDDEGVKPLIEVLHAGADPEVAIAVIEALGHLENPMAAPVLRSATRDADWRIRAKAVTALGLLADTESLEDLAAALHDPEWWVRRNAAAALGVIPGGLDRLYEALTGRDHPASRSEEHTSALQSPTRRSSDLRSATRDADWRIRAKAVTALGLLADTESLEDLAAALHDPEWWVRRNAAAALGVIPGGLDRLYEALTGRDHPAS